MTRLSMVSVLTMTAAGALLFLVHRELQSKMARECVRNMEHIEGNMKLCMGDYPPWDCNSVTELMDRGFLEDFPICPTGALYEISDRFWPVCTSGEDGHDLDAYYESLRRRIREQDRASPYGSTPLGDFRQVVTASNWREADQARAAGIGGVRAPR